MFSGVRVEEERQTWSDKAVTTAEDESGWSLINVISFEIEKATEIDAISSFWRRKEK
jgi:hypothetical protein